MKTTELASKKYLLLTIVVLLTAILGGCAAPEIADDLLDNTKRSETTLVDNPAIVFVEINPKINNYQQIDRLVKESLELALQNANVFSSGSLPPYRINANITTASQAAMSFGSFNGTLEVKYAVFDDTNKHLFTESVYTEAGSDEWSFSGAKRSNRSRAVNVSKNVLKFVEILQIKLEQEKQ